MEFIFKFINLVNFLKIVSFIDLFILKITNFKSIMMSY